MSARLASGVLVSALLRRVHDAGGNATVLARGEAQSGAILVVVLERGVHPRVVERGIGPGGVVQMISVGPQDTADDETITAYWMRRRTNDPDLWVIELDIAAAERFAAESIVND